MKHGESALDSVKISIGDFLKYNDKQNEISLRAANILSGQTCSKCANKYSSQCRKKAGDDSCWEWKDGDRYDDVF